MNLLSLRTASLGYTNTTLPPNHNITSILTLIILSLLSHSTSLLKSVLTTSRDGWMNSQTFVANSHTPDHLHLLSDTDTPLQRLLHTILLLVPHILLRVERIIFAGTILILVLRLANASSLAHSQKTDKYTAALGGNCECCWQQHFVCL